jgi:TnpA family transposase
MGIYTHVLNQWPIIYHQPIVLGNRQAGAAIEGVVRQERIDLDWLAVDAHGYTDGTVSAVQVLERFGSAAHGDPIYRAAKMLRRLLRTIYLCDYFTEFRRETHRVLNRGESVHTLQRAIHSGEIPHDRGRRPEEMHAISGSLALLTNLVIGWTSLQTEAALAVLKSRGVVFAAEVLRHVSPIRYHNINFRGTFGFPFEKYLVALLGDEASRTGKVLHG